ncbi:DNA topoisomerase IB [Sediminibacterium soli]|uniref:DNA topoisomerase IB n=1 Tax=Sediminibacterium soli TaxID=2698829 RepID=UPI00137A8C3C|nr:DNA topoisomerase IB [Sediminibacterium soli]NCI45905.1 DNA topoisomerase IB [Sediminibacterium soli]
MNPAKISHRKHLSLVKDYTRSASAANLVYVSDKDPGIARVKKGKGFAYRLGDAPVKDKTEIRRIRQLVIPPAWTKVWICTRPNGHIQATGFDARERKQYRYHPLWNVLRNETKFHKLTEFGQRLPALRLQVEKDFLQPALTEQKVIAAVIGLMERTYIRIGNTAYEKTNGSHGLTTLHDKHVSIEAGNIRFSFRGKKGINHTISLRNRKLAGIVRQCRDIPGKELFQYYDQEGNRQPVDSGMVNRYIRQHMGETFSAKDFRTWAGCLHALRAFRQIGLFKTGAECKHNINLALDEVSRQLGNTRAVCRKYYVHPQILHLYEENRIQSYLDQLDEIEKNDDRTSLTSEEKVLMSLLNAV